MRAHSHLVPSFTQSVGLELEFGVPKRDFISHNQSAHTHTEGVTKRMQSCQTIDLNWAHFLRRLV